MTPAETRRRAVALAAEPFDGVLSRERLRSLGADRDVVAREVAAGRWRCHGRQTVAVHTTWLSAFASRWRALWEIGPCAALDGLSALEAWGLRDVSGPVVHVSVPRDFRRPVVSGVRVHRVLRTDHEVVDAGVPRVRAAQAAVRAASWAGSDRQAALFLVMPVQQRIVLPAHLKVAAEEVGIRRRRGLIGRLVEDIVDGAQSLGELDFARLCTSRGLPPPDRQALRSTAAGRIYLDVAWTDIGLVVEIDGSGHRSGLAVMHDNLRQNVVVLNGETVLRIDLVGLRLQPDAFMAQVCRAYALLALRRAP